MCILCIKKAVAAKNDATAFLAFLLCSYVPVIYGTTGAKHLASIPTPSAV